MKTKLMNNSFSLSEKYSSVDQFTKQLHSYNILKDMIISICINIISRCSLDGHHLLMVLIRTWCTSHQLMIDSTHTHTHTKKSKKTEDSLNLCCELNSQIFHISDTLNWFQRNHAISSQLQNHSSIINFIMNLQLSQGFNQSIYDYRLKKMAFGMWFLAFANLILNVE